MAKHHCSLCNAEHDKYHTYAVAQITAVNENKGHIQAIALETKESLHPVGPSGTVTSDEQPAQKDLLYVESIFVSSGMNLNDDVFLPNELATAIASSPNKPVDWEHNTDQIIGHMTEAFPIDRLGNLLTFASQHPVTSGVPDQFDVVNRAVVYKWLFPEKAKEIVEGAQQGKLFVSMEVWFDSFDFLVGNNIVQ